ncbi:3-O-alpha-D-mannopyranosyl-alpha-D-mannopyranose xylosylphosphotransferase [Ceratobasidium sp. AG-Ba]|nr:3-O-alpha-D-mannopyranosyl-alpha-D-mannopyranose xylosylphosphotransferase [Ceratobasidium sp. AG-Ba]
MPPPLPYSLLPTSSPDLEDISEDQVDLDETWPTQRRANHDWVSQLGSPFAFIGRPSRLSRAVTRPNVVVVAALSTLFTLALLMSFTGRSMIPGWMSGNQPTLRECFELPAEELAWQITQLPVERSSSCPFDPESFVILDERVPDTKGKPSKDIHWPTTCLEAMLVEGETHPRSCDGMRSFLEQQHIDLVWTWVNGSSPLLEITRNDRAAEISGTASKDENTAGLAARLFRDHDELRHSVRAALKHFNHPASNFFLLGSDMPVSVHGVDANPTTGEARVGQLPSWLALEEMTVDGKFANWNKAGKKTQFQVNHHRDIFSHYEGTVFNSLAIESQFSNLERIGVSDTLYNDDVFFGRDLSGRDFHMGEHGIVMRMQNYITISPDPDVPQHDGLEWESLQYSNWLLSNRFGSRHRPYPTHLAKTLSITMLKEIASAWSEDMQLVASRAFRGMKHTTGGPADAYMVFLEHHWIVERWRETLLWSWVVAKGVDRVRRETDVDSWTNEVAQMAWEELGGVIGQSMLKVRRAPRSTLANANEWAGTKATTPTFSSLDGYPYSEDTDQRGWVSEGAECTIDFDDCFAKHDSAGRTFQRIAFEEPTACGDCIIRALVNKSGARGLKAFLPSASSRPSSGTTPVLPITSRWQDADFRLSSVFKSMANVRDDVLSMLQRYRFILGETPFMFAIVTSPQSAEQYVQSIQADSSLAIICVNDNVAEGDDRVREILGDWMSSRWNERADWEQH